MKRTSLLWAASVILSSCITKGIFAADGFGANATGGAGGTTVTVDNAADFKSYVESDLTYIVQVTGAIDLGSVIRGVNIRSNKTIKGISAGATITGRLGFTDDSNNIIIERLNITNPSYTEADGISVKDRITNLFITHCTVYDCGDGCIDISNASDYVTVSWCKFYYTNPAGAHRFVNLFSGSDTATGDRGKLHITFHHNWWSTSCDQRMPRGRFGRVHVYNNYYSCTGNLYCIGVGVESQLRVESNYFDGISSAWNSFNTSGYTPGKIGWNSDNQFMNGTTIPTWAANDYNNIFTLTYDYTPDAGANVKSIVMAGAGADGVESDLEPPTAPTGLTATTGLSTVGLDWNDNNESDLAGYNVYRSTTSGGGYSKLNSSLLSDSNYIDADIPLDTTFYYVVTALDTSANESADSNEVLGGMYGDFSGNGIVELDDVYDFAYYFWLESDCDETGDVDLDGNCVIDFYEFAFLAENWLK